MESQKSKRPKFRYQIVEFFQRKITEACNCVNPTLTKLKL